MTLALPSQRTWSVADIVTAAMMNSNVRDAVNFLVNPPLFLGYQTAAQTLTTGVSTPILLDTSIVDTYTGHSNTTNSSRYTAQVAGWYSVFAQAAYPGNATGSRAVLIRVNGANPTIALENFGSANGTSICLMPLSGMVFLNVGDYVEAFAFQSSGGNLALSSANSWMSTVWVHA